MREVYCFSRRQLIFSFSRLVIYHSKGLREYIPKSIQFVCHFVPRSSNESLDFVFYPKSLILYINGFVSTSSTNKRKAFFKLVFELMAENRKILKRIPRRGYWSKCNVLLINGFFSTCSTIFKIMVALGLCMQFSKLECAISTCCRVRVVAATPACSYQSVI